MSYSLFDIVGPVMHGPSSSHTAGANRIGFLAREIMGEEPRDVVLRFHPDYMKSYRGQRSHVALLAGCLGLREDDPRSGDALRICEERGLRWRAEALGGRSVSRNTMRVDGTAGGRRWEITGESVGGGSILIREVNGAAVRLDGNQYVCVLVGGDGTLPERIACPEADAARGAFADGTQLSLLSFSELPPELAELPAEARGNGEEEVRCRVARPLYAFRDHGGQPLFLTFEELSRPAEGEDIADLAVRYECARSAVGRETVLAEARRLVRCAADALAEAEREAPRLIGGFTDPEDGRRLLYRARSGNTAAGEIFTTALARAVLLAERNAAGCRVVAAPTGGAAGCLPAVLLTAGERYGADEEAQARALLVAAAAGMVIGNRASFSGTVGGCQSEIGIGAAMGAAAVAYLAGGSAGEVVQSAAIALKNVLGLTCDPPASPVEVPCVKRNAMGAAVAFFGAELGLSGIRSAILPDDVVDALADTQRRMPPELKFSHRGGLALTRSGAALRERWERAEREADAER